MKARIMVRLKEEVLDAPGKAVVERLQNLGFSEVKDARVGKLIELDVQSADRENALARLQLMCEKLLVNDAIEEFDIQSLD